VIEAGHGDLLPLEPRVRFNREKHILAQFCGDWQVIGVTF
jgi:hypothetical protein